MSGFLHLSIPSACLLLHCSLFYFVSDYVWVPTQMNVACLISTDDGVIIPRGPGFRARKVEVLSQYVLYLCVVSRYLPPTFFSAVPSPPAGISPPFMYVLRTLINYCFCSFPLLPKVLVRSFSVFILSFSLGLVVPRYRLDIYRLASSVAPRSRVARRVGDRLNPILPISPVPTPFLSGCSVSASPRFVSMAAL